MQHTIFLAYPCYGGAHPKSAEAAYRYPTKRHKLACIPNKSSLLAYGFNTLLCECLNTKEKMGWTHFAMLHADVAPVGPNAERDCWLDILLEEMDRVDADIMSAVVPIKGDTGITSTAIDYYPTHVQRLTMKQVFGLPETFCSADTPWPDRRLLVNTGCMVFRLDKPWLMETGTPPFFAISDTITFDEGKWRPQVEPEDWKLSRELHRRGCKVYATRKVLLEHWGEWGWGNDHVYGDDVDTREK